MVAVPRDIEDIFRSYRSHCRDLEKSPCPFPRSKKKLLDLVIYSYIFNAFENIVQRRAPQLPQPLTVSAQNGKEYRIEVMFIFWCSGIWFQRGMRLTSSCRAPGHLKGPLGGAVTGQACGISRLQGGHRHVLLRLGARVCCPAAKGGEGGARAQVRIRSASAPPPSSAAARPPLPGPQRH